jgi:hypothetical protein
MKPQLVDYEKIFQKKQVNEVNIKPKIQVKQLTTFTILMNLIGLIIIIVGCSILYHRRMSKEHNKRMQTQKIIQFYHDIN